MEQQKSGGAKRRRNEAAEDDSSEEESRSGVSSNTFAGKTRRSDPNIKRSERQRLFHAVLYRNDQRNRQRDQMLRQQLSEVMKILEPDFPRIIESYRSVSKPQFEVEHKAIRDRTQDSRQVPSLDAPEPSFWWQIQLMQDDTYVVPNVRNVRNFDSTTGLLHRLYMVTYLSKSLVDLASGTLEELKAVFLEGQDGKGTLICPWQELFDLIKEVNPFQQPEPTAFIVYTINPNRYHSKFEVGTYSRNRKVNYRSGPPSKLYLRSKRDINEMNELIIDGVHFPPWTHENCIIQRTSNGLILNCETMGQVSLRNKDGHWEKDLPCDGSTIAEEGIQIFPQYGLVPVKTPIDPDFLALWDGCFFPENMSTVELSKFAAYFAGIPTDVIAYFFCSGSSQTVVTRTDYWRVMSWSLPILQEGPVHYGAKLVALHESLRLQGLSISLRNYSAELAYCDTTPGTYYLRLSDSVPQALTLELKPPSLLFTGSTDNYRISIEFGTHIDRYLVRYSLQGGESTSVTDLRSTVFAEIDAVYNRFWSSGSMRPFTLPKTRKNYRQPIAPFSNSAPAAAYEEPQEGFSFEEEYSDYSRAAPGRSNLRNGASALHPLLGDRESESRNNPPFKSIRHPYLESTRGTFERS